MNEEDEGGKEGTEGRADEWPGNPDRINRSYGERLASCARVDHRARVLERFAPLFPVARVLLLLQ